MGTQKNRLNETVLLSTQNTCLNWWVRMYLQFYANKISLSGSMYSKSKHAILYIFFHAASQHKLFPLTFELVYSKRYKLACAPSEDSDQHAHPQSNQFFDGCLIGRQGSKVSSGRNLDCTEVQTNISLCCIIHGWKFIISKILNFRNSELKLAVCHQNIKISQLNGQIPLDNLNINQRSYYGVPKSAFWGWLSAESQPIISWIQE